MTFYSLRRSLFLISMLQCANVIHGYQRVSLLRNLQQQQQQQRVPSIDEPMRETSSVVEVPYYYILKIREYVNLYADVYPTLQDLQKAANGTTIACSLHRPRGNANVICKSHQISLNITATVHNDTGMITYVDAMGNTVDAIDDGTVTGTAMPIDTNEATLLDTNEAASNSPLLYIKHNSKWLIPVLTIVTLGTLVFFTYCTCCCCEHATDDDDDDDDQNEPKKQFKNDDMTGDDDRSGSTAFQDIDLTSIDILDEFNGRHDYEEPELIIREVPNGQKNGK